MKAKYFFPDRLGELEQKLFRHREVKIDGVAFMRRDGWNCDIVKTFIIPIAIIIEVLTYIITAILF